MNIEWLRIGDEIFRHGLLYFLLLTVLYNLFTRANAGRFRRAIGGVMFIALLIWSIALGVLGLYRGLRFGDWSIFSIFGSAPPLIGEWHGWLQSLIRRAGEWAVSTSWHYASSAFNLVASWLGPWGREILVFTPFIMIAMDPALPQPIRNSVAPIIGLWTLPVVLYFFIWATWVCATYPIAIIHVLSWIGLIYILGLSNSIRSTLTSGRRKNDQDADQAIIHISMLAMFLAYWFSARIASEVLIQLYSALLSGLLAVAGFAGLVFTFSYDRISMARQRAKVARDTSELYRVIGFLSAACIIGFAFFSSNPVAFEVRSAGIPSALATIAALVVIFGTILAIKMTITLFVELVGIFTGTAKSSNGITLVVAEVMRDPSLGTSSDSPGGFSHLKGYAEDQGFGVQTLPSVDVNALEPHLSDAIVLIPRSDSDADLSSLSNLCRWYVSKGGTLIVTIDQYDAQAKTALLKAFDLKATAFPASPQGAASQAEIRGRDLKGLAGGGAIEDFSIYFPQAVWIAEAPAGDLSDSTVTMQPLRSVAEGKAGDVAGPVIAYRDVGLGRVVVVGGVLQWQNHHFESNVYNQSSFRAVLRLAEGRLRTREVDGEPTAGVTSADAPPSRWLAKATRVASGG